MCISEPQRVLRIVNLPRPPARGHTTAGALLEHRRRGIVAHVLAALRSKLPWCCTVHNSYACTVEYRQSAPHRLSAPPIFPHRKNWYRECAPPRLSAPPPFSERPLSRYLASDERLLPVISHPTLPPCIMKFQNVRDISRGTWSTIVSAFTRDVHSMIVVVVLSA